MESQPYLDRASPIGLDLGLDLRVRPLRLVMGRFRVSLKDPMMTSDGTRLGLAQSASASLPRKRLRKLRDAPIFDRITFRQNHLDSCILLFELLDPGAKKSRFRISTRFLIWKP